MVTTKKVISVRTPHPRFIVINQIQKRFSPRVYSSEKVNEEDLKIIFEAARFAPSGRNHQPWFYFVTLKGTKAYEDITSCIPIRNTWAVSAPVIILVCYDPTEPKGIVNRWALFDVGASVMSLVLQAQELGCYCRQIGSFDWDKAASLFPIKEPLKPFSLIALGKIGTDIDYQKADPKIVEKDLTISDRKNEIYKILK